MSDGAAPHPSILELRHNSLVNAIDEVFDGRGVRVQHHWRAVIGNLTLGLHGYYIAAYIF